MAGRLVLVQTVVPAYRCCIFDALDERADHGLVVFAGERFFEPSVRTAQIARKRKWFHSVENKFLGGSILWQRGSVRAAVRADTCILELNPRIISSIVVLALRRLLRRPTTVWGHGASRDGRRRAARTMLLRAANRIICYTEAERSELPAWAKSKALTASNALYSKAELDAEREAARPREHRSDFLYVGRLSADKEVLLLIEAFALVVHNESFQGRLVLVGTGPLHDELEQAAARLGVKDRCIFRGAVFEFAELSDIYASAIAALSPGYMGLSVVQAMSFGVPMIAADVAPHAPEQILASVDGATDWFVRGDAESLASVMRSFAPISNDRRANLQQYIRDHHSTDAMVEALASSVR